MKKIIYVLVLLAMSLTMVACGGKNDSGGSSSSRNVNMNSYSVQTVTGTIDLNQPYNFVASNGTYQFQKSQAMDLAFQNAQNRGVIVSGVTRYTVRMVGIFSSYNNGYNNGMNNGYGMLGQVQVQSAEFSR